MSFLWELGYQLWAPVFTIPFALLQGFIFQRTRSLAYIVTVHLSFDAIIFMILVHAAYADAVRRVPHLALVALVDGRHALFPLRDQTFTPW